jgi:hypothetical protein
MPALPVIVTILWPIAIGFGALFALARYSDSIARRVAPEMLPRDSRPPRWDMPKTLLGWLQFIALRIGAIAVVLAYIAGPIALQFATVALILVVFAYDAYKRTRPLVARGATRRETMLLTLLGAVWVLSWTYFIFRFTYHRYVAG